jgi:hypothetical protein
VNVGSTTVMNRIGSASETALVGKVSFSIGHSQVWNAQTWTSTPAQALTVGTAAENLATPLLIDFRGNMGPGTADSLNLVDFTVIRHPAQSNP